MKLPSIFRRAAKVLDLSKFTSPPKAWLDKIEQESVHTPDVWKLEQRRWHLLFCHDDVKVNELHHNKIADDMLKVAQGFTKQNFAYFHEQETATPIALPPLPVIREVWPIDRGPIRGELYGVGTNQLMRLDLLRENGVKFQRVRVPIDIRSHWVRFTKEPYIRELLDSSGFYHSAPNVGTLQAWMYVGLPEHWRTKMDNSPVNDFQRVQIMTPNNKKFRPYFNYASRTLE